MHEVKSFQIFQTAKVMAVIYAIMAAIFGVFFAFGALWHGHPVRAIMAIILIPILYAVISFVMVAFTCWLYNEVAKHIGGIAFELLPQNDD